MPGVLRKTLTEETLAALCPSDNEAVTSYKEVHGVRDSAIHERAAQMAGIQEREDDDGGQRMVGKSMISRIKPTSISMI